MGDIEDAFVARYDPISREMIRKHPRALIHYNHVEETGESRRKRYRAVTEIDTVRPLVPLVGKRRPLQAVTPLRAARL